MPPRIPAVLSKGSQLLDLLAERSPRSVAEIADQLAMPRPSVYRMLDALELIGLVQDSEDGQFRLGTALLQLGDAAKDAIPEVATARPILQYVNDRTGLTVYICASRGGAIRCLDWVQSNKIGLLLLQPGGSLPPHAGATSRAILAFDDELRADVLARGQWHQFTPNTLVSRQAIEDDSRLVRERGYSISDEDVTLGIAAIGVPLIDRSGILRGALSVAGLRDDVINTQLECVEVLRNAAATFANRLG